MSIREQFESWYLDNWGHTEDHHETLFERSPDDESEYYRLGVRMAHQAWQAATSAMEAKCAALAADNAGLKADVPMGAIENGRAFAERLEAYPFECQGGDLNMCSDWQELRRCFDHLSEWAMHSQQETPATDSFLAEVRASAIPEGYVLVPQEMHLSSEAMEGICFHCGDGGHQFGEFTDGTLFVGEVDYGDGKKVHGLHIATADYPEEGCATICEFAAQLRKGAAQ